VARARIRSRPADAESGHEIRCEGGAISAVRPSACPRGTTIEVRDLFFNTPARRQFLKTPRAERGRVHDMLLRLALARPDVDFTLEVDGQEALRLPADEALSARIGRALGKIVGAGMRPVSQDWDTYHVEGFAGSPDVARRDSTLELLFVNGRLARDKSVTFAVRQAYRDFLMGGRYPVYVLMLTLPPEQVDVNVHPTKSEVRFLEARRVCGLLHDAVRASLLATSSQRSAGPALSVSEAKPRAHSGFPELPRRLFEAPQASGAAAETDGFPAPSPATDVPVGPSR
jgi:DNA mismatch repair protein MutL